MKRYYCLYSLRCRYCHRRQTPGHAWFRSLQLLPLKQQLRRHIYCATLASWSCCPIPRKNKTLSQWCVSKRRFNFQQWDHWCPILQQYPTFKAKKRVIKFVGRLLWLPALAEESCLCQDETTIYPMLVLGTRWLAHPRPLQILHMSIQRRRAFPVQSKLPKEC